MRSAPFKPQPLVLVALAALTLTLLSALLPRSEALAMNIQQVRSPGGISAWLVEEHKVPLLALRFAFDGGSSQDLPGKEGLANFVSGMLDEGAGDLDSSAFQERMEELAMKMGFEDAKDSFYGQFETLTENRDASVDLLRLAINNPRFDADAVERVRGQLLTALAFAAKDPQKLVNREWFALAFPGHPYGRPGQGTPDTVRAITRDDLEAYRRRTFAKDTLKVVEMDVPQSVAQFGIGAMPRKDPDFIAASVLNQILGGGGFASRLMEEVREKRGLAYSVYTYLQPFQHASVFAGGVATKNDEIAQSLEVIRSELRRMAADGPTQTELDNAESYLTGSFALRFDSNAKIANQLLWIMVEGLGIDYVEKRNKLVEAVTLEDLKRVARRLLDTDAMIVTVVGKPKNLHDRS